MKKFKGFIAGALCGALMMSTVPTIAKTNIDTLYNNKVNAIDALQDRVVEASVIADFNGDGVKDLYVLERQGNEVKNIIFTYKNNKIIRMTEKKTGWTGEDVRIYVISNKSGSSRMIKITQTNTGTGWACIDSNYLKLEEDKLIIKANAIKENSYDGEGYVTEVLYNKCYLNEKEVTSEKYSSYLSAYTIGMQIGGSTATDTAASIYMAQAKRTK